MQMILHDFMGEARQCTADGGQQLQNFAAGRFGLERPLDGFHLPFSRRTRAVSFAFSRIVWPMFNALLV